jgi:putative hemolysin
MNGEYSGYCIDGGNPEVRKRTAEGMFNESSTFGYWLGKAFKPVSTNQGEGYNFCRRPGGWVQRYFRYGTSTGNSHVDGKPAFMIYYREFNNSSGKADLTDEVRTLAPGLFLAISTMMLPDGRRSQPGPFFLAGPIGPWVGVDDEEAERL